MFIVRGCRCGTSDFFDRLSGHNRNTTAASSNRRGMDLGNDKSPAARRFFSFCRRAAGCGENRRADGLCDRSQVHRLCVYASGSLMTVTTNFFASIRNSRLHFGQNTGNLIRIVSSYIFARVLFPQTGQGTQREHFFVIKLPFLMAVTTLRHASGFCNRWMLLMR